MIIKNEKHFKEYSLNNYVNPHCLSLTEFENDIKTIFLIKRLFKKFLLGNEINPIILMNLFVSLRNVFPDETVFEEILIYKIEDYYYGNLKSVLMSLTHKIGSEELLQTTANKKMMMLLNEIKYKYIYN
jgi:hypothetical protein